MNLSEPERQHIAERAARLEARCGVEAVVTIAGRCDAYPEAPWKAFALFSALGAFASILLLPNAVLGIPTFLGAGAAAALATVFIPPFARLFVGAARRETEARQYASACFLARGIGRTERRNGLLLLVGLFERTVVILPDAGLDLAEAELKPIIAGMAPQLAVGRLAPALLGGLDALEALLAAKGRAGGGRDEIAQEVFVEKGA